MEVKMEKKKIVPEKLHKTIGITTLSTTPKKENLKDFFEPDCSYKDTCSSRGHRCSSCKHNKKKKDYYERDEYNPYKPYKPYYPYKPYNPSPNVRLCIN